MHTLVSELPQGRAMTAESYYSVLASHVDTLGPWSWERHCTLSSGKKQGDRLPSSLVRREGFESVSSQQQPRTVGRAWRSPGRTPLLTPKWSPSPAMWLAWLVPLPEEMFLATGNTFSGLMFFLWFFGTWAPACFLVMGKDICCRWS